MVVKTDTQRWQTLYTIARDLYQYDPLHLGRSLQGVLERLGELTELRMGCIITFRDDGTVGEAYTLDLDSFGSGLWEHLFDRGLMGFVHHSQRTIVIRNIAKDPRWSTPPPDIAAPHRGSAIGIPLRRGDQPLGVMLFVHGQVDAFTDSVRGFLEEVAELVAEAASKERVRRQEQQTSDRYQWLFEDAITPVIITNMTGSIVTANREACRFLDYDAAILQGMSIRDLRRTSAPMVLNGNGSTSRDTKHPTGQALQTNLLSAHDTMLIRSDGEELPVRLKMRKRHFRGNPVIEYVVQDISAEVELSQLRNDLTAMVFHDLRAPLSNIKYSLAVVERFIKDNPAALNALHTARSSNIQLERMVASLLDIQRLEGGEAIIHPRLIPVGRVVSSAIEQTSAIVEAAGLQLSLKANGNIPQIFVDPEMIRRVLTNLIENATKYAADGGTVTLRVNSEVGFVHMVVADDGPGIEEAVRQQIFDKFSRLKHEDAPHGVGLGLTFCKLAVEAHGGRIWVESEVGNGSEFHFTVPVREENVPARAK
ncbi:MAG: ATP-binding protein [Chloroflexota bacterium]